MIPKLHYISQGNTPTQHLENIQKACTCGIELVQLSLIGSSKKKTFKLCLAGQGYYRSFPNQISDYRSLQNSKAGEGRWCSFYICRLLPY